MESGPPLPPEPLIAADRRLPSPCLKAESPSTQGGAFLFTHIEPVAVSMHLLSTVLCICSAVALYLLANSCQPFNWFCFLWHWCDYVRFPAAFLAFLAAAVPEAAMKSTFSRTD